MNTTIPDYVFAPTGGGDETGFNDSVVTTFKSTDNSYHLARESIQNIIDAKDPEISGPVRASFSLLNLDHSDLPKSDRLIEIFKGCRAYEPDCDEGNIFYTNAIRKIETASFIPVLKISDFNTVGLDEKNYSRLLKSVGSSSKSSGAGGSFGLGKGAYFAASNFRTIFVSSIYGDNKFIFQGKLRLSSREENGEMLQGNGTFGLAGQFPVTNLSQVPDIFKRTKKGTDIYIIDFTDPDNWKKTILKSVLNNFWLAVIKDELIVNLDGIEVNKNTLEKLMYSTFNPEDNDGKEELGNPIPYYRAYTDTGSEIFSENLPTLGDVELRLLTNENFPGRVAHFRKTHMLIFKEHPFCPKAYAAVFICENEDGNRILRTMENTTHNKWSKNSGKNTDDHLKKQKSNAEKELKDFIQGIISKIGGSEDGRSLKVPGLENYLYLPGFDDDFEGNGASGNRFSGKYSVEETASEIGKEEGAPLMVSPPIKPLTPVKQKDTGLETPTGTVTDVYGRGKKHRGKHTDPTIKKIEEGNKPILTAVPVKFRSFSVKTDQGYMQILKVIGPPDKRLILDIKAGTDEGYESLKIIEAKLQDNTPVVIKNNMLTDIRLDGDGIGIISVLLESDDKYSINLRAYENK